MVNQGRFCCLPSAQHYTRARYGKSCVSSVSRVLHEKEEKERKEEDEDDFFGGLFLSSHVLKGMFASVFVNC